MNYEQFDATLKVVDVEIRKIGKLFTKMLRHYKKGERRKFEVLYRETSFNVQFVKNAMEMLERHESLATSLYYYQAYKKETMEFIRQAEKVLEQYRLECEKDGNRKQ